MEVALNVTRCPTKPWPPDWDMLCSIGFPYVHFVSICPLDPQVCKPIWGKRFLNPQHRATQFKQRKVSKQVWEDMMVCFVLFDYREKDREQQDSIHRTTKLKNHSSMHQQPQQQQQQRRRRRRRRRWRRQGRQQRQQRQQPWQHTTTATYATEAPISTRLNNSSGSRSSHRDSAGMKWQEMARMQNAKMQQFKQDKKG